MKSKGFLISLITLLILFVSDCKKPERVVKVNTLDIISQDITYDQVTLKGEIIDIADRPADDHGILIRNMTASASSYIEISLGAVSNEGVFTVTFADPISSNVYEYHAYVKSGVDILVGELKNFTALTVSAPSLTTAALSEISETGATSGGVISSNEGPSITEKGVCWSTSPDPDIEDSHTNDGDGNDSFTSSLSGLSRNTKYYLRAYVTNSLGTEYGQQIRLKTYSGTVTDIDGNVYYTVDIGSQIWMAENLITSHYSNGDAIPFETSNATWIGLSTGAYSYYNNDHDSADIYGALYNWHAVIDSRNVCPDGWHVPTDAEYKILTDYLGEENVAGGKLKETGTIHWDSPNTGATNESSFTGLPGGCREAGGEFNEIGALGNWWLSTEYSSTHAETRSLYSDNVLSGTGNADKKYGFSVRCLKGQGASLPGVSTDSPDNVNQNSATVGGEVTDDGGDAVSDRGVYFSTTASPETTGTKLQIGSGTGVFSTSLTGLTPGTTYFIKAYATNSVGTAYGDELSFTTDVSYPSCPEETTVTDFNGNNYNTVEIGGVCWLRENLRSTNYADGTALVDGSGLGDIAGDNSTKYYFFYNDDAGTYADPYGALYTWAAAMNGQTSADAGQNGVQGVCPTGWHLPDDDEWKELETFLGMDGGNLDITGWRGTDQGGKLKETGNEYWNDPNNGATNESGFFARGAGYRGSITNYYGYINDYTDWWTATDYSSNEAWYRSVHNNETQIYRLQYPMHNGFSVRCTKNDLASVTTESISSITTTTAVSGGVVFDMGRGTVSDKGVCWNTSGSPDLTDQHTSDGSGLGSFVSNLGSLTANTTYYVRAFATSEHGTVYGNEISFITASVTIATVSTTVISNITDVSADSGGDVSDDGGATIMERGVCWNTGGGPTTADSKISDAGTTGAFISTLSGLTPQTTYYTRAFATNSVGTAYGDEISFITNPPAPSLIAWYPFNNNVLDESGNGHDGTNFGAIPVFDRFGNANSAMLFDDSYIDCNSPLLPETGDFTINMWIYPDSLTGALWGQYEIFTNGRTSVYIDDTSEKLLMWHAREGGSIEVYSTYALQTKNWYMATFIRQNDSFKMYVNGVHQETQSLALMSVLNRNFLLGIHNETYDPTEGFNGIIDDVRIYDVVISDGDIFDLYQENGWTGKLSVSDYDGNPYDVVHIGEQLWMTENLKTTKYNDGTSIPLVTIDSEWNSLTTPGYCWYANDEVSNKDTYGALYNWYSVNTGVLCPTGWHVPTQAEWTVLTDFLGSATVAGGKLKETGTIHWADPNEGATNESGFTALPGGARSEDFAFHNITQYGGWWCHTEFDGLEAYYRKMAYTTTSVNTYSHPKENGYSVRCLKD